MGTPAADCHAHVFCPALPYDSAARYRPERAQLGTVRHFLAVLDAHGMTHGLLVGAQPYGTDNRCLEEALEFGAGRLRGIALLPPEAEPALVTRLAAAGVVGARINLASDGLRDLLSPGMARSFAAMREAGWWLQVHGEGDQFAEAAPLLRATGLPLVFDHLGRPDLTRDLDQPGFRALLEFGREGRHVIKLSGAFRFSRTGPPFADTDRFAAAAIAAFGTSNCVWGSDWPFVLTEDRVDYGPCLACLMRWLPGEPERRMVLWETPRRAFGFRQI